MPDTERASLAMLVAERIRRRSTSEPFQVGERSRITVTVSIGVSSLHVIGRDAAVDC